LGGGFATRGPAPAVPADRSFTPRAPAPSVLEALNANLAAAPRAGALNAPEAFAPTQRAQASTSAAAPDSPALAPRTPGAQDGPAPRPPPLAPGADGAALPPRSSFSGVLRAPAPLVAAAPAPYPSASSLSGLISPLPLPPISVPTFSTAGLPSRLPPPPLMTPPPPAHEEVLEIADSEVESMESELDPHAVAVVSALEEAREEEEVIASDEGIQAVENDSSAPPSGIDPWLAQVVHGYCPPGSDIFERHVPPTTMPGRDT
jgi:hypothetical protein